jgi:hypothetical protein
MIRAHQRLPRWQTRLWLWQGSWPLGQLVAILFILLCILTSPSAHAELAIGDVTARGRPANLYAQSDTPVGEFRLQCEGLLESLNEPTHAPATDVRAALLQNSFSVSWNHERLENLAAKLALSDLRTAKIRGPQGDFDVAVFSNLVHDRIQDEAFVISSGLQYLREESGSLGERFFSHLKVGADPNVHRLVTQPLWKLEVAGRTAAEADSIVPLSGDAYWIDVVSVDRRPFALITPPIAFKQDGTLRRKIEIFVLTLREQGLGDKACHFVTNQ